MNDKHKLAIKPILVSVEEPLNKSIQRASGRKNESKFPFPAQKQCPQSIAFGGASLCRLRKLFNQSFLNNTRIVYNGFAAPSFDPGWFEAAESKPSLVSLTSRSVAKGRGSASFLTVAGRPCVFKRYHRGGLLARFVSDGYLYTGEQRTRSFSEWYFLFALQKMNLPAPVPVAARYRRFGLFYTADLITEYCRNTRTLSQMLAQGPLAAFLWRAVGRTIRRYHDAGVYHADLNAHNVLLDEERGEVTLVDFDRACRSRCAFLHRRNLLRLERSLNKLAGLGKCPQYRTKDFQVLLRAYEDAP